MVATKLLLELTSSGVGRLKMRKRDWRMLCIMRRRMREYIAMMS